MSPMLINPVFGRGIDSDLFETVSEVCEQLGRLSERSLIFDGIINATVCYNQIPKTIVVIIDGLGSETPDAMTIHRDSKLVFFDL